MNKSSKAEVEQRVSSVYQLLLRRESTANILRFAADKWGVSQRQAETYIAMARDRLRQDVASDRQQALTEHLALRRDLYNQAYKAKQWMVCFMIAQDEAKLLSLYQTTEDHIKAVLGAGYLVFEPGEQAKQMEAAAVADVDVEIVEAVPS